MKPLNEDVAGCEVHILVCTNERPPGKDCCKKVGGQELYQRVKEKIRGEGLIATHWATRTGCLGFCNSVGTTVTIHAKGQSPRWFTEVKAEDFDALWNEIRAASRG